MNHPTRSRLARLTAMSLLLVVILLLSLHPAAWATPTQNPAGQSVPTKTPKPTNTPKPTKTPKPITAPPGTKLNVSSVTCAGQNVWVNFVVVQLPNNVTNYGIVTYVVNGNTRTATFDKRTGDTAHYIGLILPAQQSLNRTYHITSGSVTITTTTGSFTLPLHNPGTFHASCSTVYKYLSLFTIIRPY